MIKKLLKAPFTGFMATALLFGSPPGISQTVAYASQKEVQEQRGGTQAVQLKNVLNALKSNYQVDIMFELKSVDGLTVPANVVNLEQSLERNLDKILTPFGLTFKKVNRQSYLVLGDKKRNKPTSRVIREPEEPLHDLTNRTYQSIPAQNRILGQPPSPERVAVAERQVSGRVTDESQAGLPGVNILVKGTQQGSTTDSEGNFTLVVPDEKAVLVFSFVGYVTQEILVGSRTSLEISLVPDEMALEEVVVVGYGTVKRKDLTGSVSSVSGTTLKDIPVTSASDAIVGRMPGVQVTRTEGAPDADIKIRVRGGGSITQDNSPLFLVDGFPVSNINDISPADILSIDVLKDASSTAIYGARGANGVIMITTRGGKEGKGKVSYNMFYGQKQITKFLEVLDPYEFVFWQYEMRNATTGSNNTLFQRNFGDFRDIGLYKQITGTNWQREILGRTGSSLSNNLSFSGGTKATKYNVSLTRNDEEEVMIGSGYQRHNLTIRTNSQINNWLSLDLNTRLSDYRLKGAGTSSNGRLFHIVQFRPVNGLSDFVDSDLTDDDYEISSTFTLNPLKQTQDDYRRQNSLTLNVNGAFNLKLPVPNLSYRLEFGKQYLQRTNQRFYGINTSNALLYGAQPLASIAKVDQGGYRIANILTYSKNNFLPGSNLNIMAGQELNYEKSINITSSVNYLPKYIDPVSALSMMQLGNAEPVVTSDNPDVKLSSFFGRVNYDYKGKYLFSATLRADGSSKFAVGNRWGYFPSAALAWRLSDESFLQGARSFLDDLKLRVSYGAAGNNRIPDNTWQKTLSVTTGGLFIGGEEIRTAYLVPNATLSNPYLKWETTVTRNLGLDFALFKHRLSGTFELYKNTTRDLLIRATIPSNTGYTNQYQNIGQTSNRGLEITLDGVLVEHKDFKLSASFNIGFNINRIDKLGETKRWEQTSGISASTGPFNEYLVEEGGKVGLMYGYQTAGMYSFDDFTYENGTYTIKEGVPSNREAINTRWFRPGALKFVEQNGDDVVDANDKVIIGDANPKHTGGFNLMAQFKGFDFSAFLNWVYGNDIFNANKLYFTTAESDRSYRNLLAIMNSEDRFTNISKVTGQVVDDPAELAEMNKNAKYWSAQMVRAPLHSWAIEDGSFLRLNNLTLGYSLPRELLSRIKLEQLRVYITGYNLGILTRYSGYDPEVDSIRSTPLTPGIDYNAYPRSRSYNVGLNLTF